MNVQPREDENTELRCVKDSHASWAEITRPMFRNLLAEWPVLGQPDQFTKVLSLRFLRVRSVAGQQALLWSQALTCTRLAVRTFMRAA